MEGYITLIQLLCAHFIADFALQTNGITRGKRKAGIAGLCYQLIHAAIHGIAAYLLVAQWDCWIIPVSIFASHFIIDFTKYKYVKPSLTAFISDQICHIAVIVVIWWALYGDSLTLACLESVCWAKVWTIALAYILMLKPSSLLLGQFLAKWTPKSQKGRSLPNAGKWIGYIERLLILTFILTGSMEGVGFLLAAKSIFRFGELSKTTEIRTTEYVLIGTLSSFAIAIFVGIAVNALV